MEADELLGEMSLVQPEGEGDTKRERLISMVCGGKSAHYLGKNYTPDEIRNFPDDKINTLYGRYESRLGAAMTKTIRSSILGLYTHIAGRFFHIHEDDVPKFRSELDEDPFIDHAISGVCCELYYKYGMFLAPITTAITTAKYCQIKNKCNINDGNRGNNSGEDEGGGDFSSTSPYATPRSGAGDTNPGS